MLSSKIDLSTGGWRQTPTRELEIFTMLWTLNFIVATCLARSLSHTPHTTSKGEGKGKGGLNNSIIIFHTLSFWLPLALPCFVWWCGPTPGSNRIQPEKNRPETLITFWTIVGSDRSTVVCANIEGRTTICLLFAISIINLRLTYH